MSGTLTLNIASLRSRTLQSRAGGADRRATGDGGHYIAARFNGPTEAFSHFAQNKNFNRSGYKALENQWALATSGGKTVSVTITPSYDGASQRPSVINVRYSIDGVATIKRFLNEHQEKSHEK